MIPGNSRSISPGPISEGMSPTEVSSPLKRGKKALLGAAGRALILNGKEIFMRNSCKTDKSLKPFRVGASSRTIYAKDALHAMEIYRKRLKGVRKHGIIQVVPLQPKKEKGEIL